MGQNFFLMGGGQNFFLYWGAGDGSPKNEGETMDDQKKHGEL